MSLVNLRVNSYYQALNYYPPLACRQFEALKIVVLSIQESFAEYTYTFPTLNLFTSLSAVALVSSLWVPDTRINKWIDTSSALEDF